MRDELGHERGTRQIVIEERDECRNGGHLMQRPQHVRAPFSTRLHVLILTSSRPHPVLVPSALGQVGYGEKPDYVSIRGTVMYVPKEKATYYPAAPDTGNKVVPVCGLGCNPP